MFEAPDLLEPVVGYRQWRVDAEGLRSVWAAERWPTAILDATCVAGTHPGEPAPAPSCGCGVYAWYRRVPRLASAATDDLVCGAVVLWGRIELHVTGMRGQHARLVALALPLGPGRKRRAVLEVAERLGVPAVRYLAVPALALCEGRPVPDALKPATTAPPRRDVERRLGPGPAGRWGRRC